MSKIVLETERDGFTLREEVLENALRWDRTESARNRSSSSFVSAVPIQKTRRGL